MPPLPAHHATSDFALKVCNMALTAAAKSADLPPKVRALLDEELSKLLGGKPAAEVNGQYYDAHKNQLPHVISAGLAKCVLHGVRVS